MPKIAYEVLKASPHLPGQAAGMVVDLDDGDDGGVTELLVSKGYLKKKPHDVAAENLADLIDAYMRKHMPAATAVSKSRLGGAHRGGLVPDPAEAEDAGTFPDWLRCVSGVGPRCAFGDDFAASARNRISKKYPGSRFNPNFDRDYAGSVKMEEQISKAGLRDPDTISKTTIQVESVGALGGYTVPPEFDMTPLKLMTPKSLFLGKVQQRTILAQQLILYAPDYSTGAAGVSPYLAGMTGSWLGEGQTLSYTTMKLRQLNLKANNFGALTATSIQLIRDGIGVDSLLRENFAATAAFYMDLAIFSGSGIDQPLGMFAAANPGKVAVNRTAGAGGLFQDTANMDAALIPDEGSEGRAFWVTSPSGSGVITTMNDASGRVVFQPLMPAADAGSAAVRARRALDGMPLFKSQFPAAAGTAKDLCLVDPSGYICGMRSDLEVAVSDQFAFDKFQLVYRFMARMDGQPWLNSTVTMQNGDVTSPFVYRN